MEKEYRLWRMTWPEVGACLQETDLVLLPVGAVEQHGPHMPLDTDTFISRRICELCAEACQQQNIFIAMAHPINYGVSWYHRHFPGTVSIPSRLFIDYVYEICSSLYRHGFVKIVLVNSHGGNAAALTVAANLLHESTGQKIYLARWRNMVGEAAARDVITGGVHCDELETSLALALGQRVQKDLAVKEAFDRRVTLAEKGEPVSGTVKYDAHQTGPFIDVSMDYIKEISSSGIVGDATRASVELGNLLLQRVLECLTRLCLDLSAKK